MGAVGLQTYIWNNNLKSILLLIGFPFLLAGMIFAAELLFVGGGFQRSDGGYTSVVTMFVQSLPLAIAVACIWFVIAYFGFQAIIDLSTGARPVERKDQPELYNLLENLAISRGMRTPTLRIVDTDAMNAFASGLHEGSYSVTVTRGLLDAMDKDELEAVLAHELTHVINKDVRLMVIASIFAGAITLLAQVIFRSIMWGGIGGGRRRDRRGGGGVAVLIALAIAAVGYVLAIVVQMAISRKREYLADAGSVELTKNPDAMISALQKIDGHSHIDAPESVRTMFLDDHGEGFMGLFDTHPPIDKRIAALVKFAGGRLIDSAPTPGGDGRPAALPQTAQIDPTPAPTRGPWVETPTPASAPAPTPSGSGKQGPWG